MFKRKLRKKLKTEIKTPPKEVKCVDLDEFPTFKYHDDVLGNKIFVEEEIICECCGKKSCYKLDLVLYSQEDVENLCPVCVANGAAAAKYHGFFNDTTISEPVDNKAAKEELTKRNPGYPSWQDQQWLAHCNDYCKFVKAVGYEDIKHLDDELKDDYERLAQEFSDDVETFKKSLVNGGYMQAYLFQCVHCGKHRLHVDLD